MTREVRQYMWLRSSVVAIGAAFFVGAVMTLVRLWPILQELARPTKISCGCAVMAIQSPWWVTTIGLLAVGLIVWSVVRFVITMVRHIRSSHLQIRDLGALNMRTIFHHRQRTKFFLVETAEPIAVTIGMFRPSIYLSTGLLRRLSGSEIESVIAHEQAHQRAHDPLMTAVMDSLVRTYHWIPRISAWMAVAYSLRELAADAHATNNYRTTTALASAFLKLNDTIPLAQGNSFSPNHDRIEKLLDRHWTRRQVWSNWLTVAVFGIAMFAMLAIGRYAKAVTPNVPPLAVTMACHQTIIMCQSPRWVSPKPQTVCGTGRCLTVEHAWSPAYVISFTR